VASQDALMSVPAGSIRCLQYPFVTRRVERVHRCPKNCTHCYRRSGVQFKTRGHACADPRPSRRLGRAYHFCRIAFRLRPPFARITSDAQPFGMRLTQSDRFYTPTLILAGGGLLALARRRRRQLVA